MIRFKKAIAAVAAAATLGLGVAATSPRPLPGAESAGAAASIITGARESASALASAFSVPLRPPPAMAAVIVRSFATTTATTSIRAGSATEREFDGGNPAPSPPANEAPPFQAGLFA